MQGYSTENGQIYYAPAHSRKREFAFIFALGLVYLAFVLVTDLKIPCAFNAVTGLKCPGCGITTMIVSLAQFDFHGAFAANPFLFLTAPLLASEIAYSMHKTSRGMPLPRWNTICVYIYCGALLIFAVVRNLIGA